MKLLNLVLVISWFTCIKALFTGFQEVKPSTISATNNELAIYFVWSQPDEAAGKNATYYLELVSYGDSSFSVIGNKTIAANASSPVVVRFAIPRNISGNGEIQASPLDYDRYLAQGISMPSYSVGVTYLAESGSEESSQTIATTNPANTSSRDPTQPSSDTLPTSSSVGTSSITFIPPETSHTSTAGSESETHSASSSPDTPKGTIAGAVVGAILFLSAIVILVWHYRRRLNSRRHVQLSQSTVVPYTDKPDTITKRRRKGRRYSVPEDISPVQAALHHPDVDIINPNEARNIEARNITSREPRFVFHDDSGWRPPQRPLTQPDVEATSTYVIDMPPHYDAAL
ncbi:hypothetical protein WG66_013653 [Moniliophthora roreri]|nr:hypothetical protein WG66_013653 [Moniliophthora roreri]